VDNFPPVSGGGGKLSLMNARAGSEVEKSRDRDSRPGPVYDAVLKAMFEFDLRGACRLLGVPVEGEPVALAVEFTLTTKVVDLLVKVGPNRLMHVEYARRASDELVPRMLLYRGLIMQQFPKHHLSQHIVVLGEGTVTGFDNYEQNDFAVNLDVLYLRDADPDQFMDDVNFAPLALLRRIDPAEKVKVAARVIEMIRERGGKRLAQLLEFIAVLAVIASDRAVVEKIIEETEMTVESIAEFYRDTSVGQQLCQEGKEKGREEEREALLAALITERFGPSPQAAALAHRLARLPDGAHAVHLITTATSLGDLQPPDSAG